MRKEKLVTVYHNGKLERTTYEQICHDLEINPFVNFVTVTPAHTIGFSAGKPSEINALFFNCVREGYKVSKALAKCVYQLDSQAQAFLEAQRIDNIPTLNWADKLLKSIVSWLDGYTVSIEDRPSVLTPLYEKQDGIARQGKDSPAMDARKKDDPAL